MAEMRSAHAQWHVMVLPLAEASKICILNMLFMQYVTHRVSPAFSEENQRHLSEDSQGQCYIHTEMVDFMGGHPLIYVACITHINHAHGPSSSQPGAVCVGLTCSGCSSGHL